MQVSDSWEANSSITSPSYAGPSFIQEEMHSCNHWFLQLTAVYASYDHYNLLWLMVL